MFSTVKNNRGFSFVEVMIALLVVGILAAGASSAFSNYMKSGFAVAGGTITDTTVLPITDPIVTYDWNGQPLLDSNGQVVVAASANGAMDANVFYATNITLTPGPVLKQDTTAGTGDRLSTLTVTDNRPGYYQARTIPVHVTYSLTTGEITSCISGIDKETEVLTNSCLIQSNNQTVWDPTLQRCVPVTPRPPPPPRPPRPPPPPVIVVRSNNPFTVSCPTGQVAQNCSLYPPPGWVNNLPLITETYQPGNMTRSVQPPPAVCLNDPSGTSCTCYYANGLDPNQGVTILPPANLDTIFTINLSCIPAVWP